jgi:hypothetical protein
MECVRFLQYHSKMSRSTWASLGGTEDSTVDQFHWPGSDSTQPTCRPIVTTSMAVPGAQRGALQGSEHCVETAFSFRMPMKYKIRSDE